MGKILTCRKCKCKVGEINKGGFDNKAVIYCHKCNAEIQSKLIMKESNYGENDLAGSFLKNIMGG